MPISLVRTDSLPSVTHQWQDRRRRPSSSAFTLVEVLVALVILAVISTILARILQGGLRTRQLQQEQVQALNSRADAVSLQFAGESDEPVVTLEPIEEEK